MKSRLTIAGHPLHPMVVAFPIALYSTALVCDVLYLITQEAFWFKMAFWTIAFGVITHVGAAATGLPDFLAIMRERTEARRPATSHLVFGVSLLVIQGLNLALAKRRRGSDRCINDLALSRECGGGGAAWRAGLVWRRIGLPPPRRGRPPGSESGQRAREERKEALALGKSRVPRDESWSWPARGGPGEMRGWGGRVKIGKEPRPTGEELVSASSGRAGENMPGWVG